ncbi:MULTISPECIES: carbamoyltransferase C-terminal domain-containing protein [Streptomyces]|uniref:carbamoyltransferase C-terminal domain-containing protein n=1 Tax=Streptomyces TaxID=1883 RepID=UPI00103CEA7B|nr:MULTISPECIES: carbamoyltransferase C-terminal domain-containing protein [Streptomyces]MBT3077308.1 carbamoyltransferase [Streptomyces sp. COG21]MBT3082626.1 carbamoyltransferase [Streptomyces sp. COG20]MBT3087446.1 carbamoyltransferase [Streptomyces sp. CYG21]MBT3097523.1 carbamoyltransferase [Streptomyces sp. CBG30]MBT3104602.1 carbamoyltransferase [Streptomyces sp. COG19]
MPAVLGLNFHHDTAAALVVDGRIYAAEEERWSGVKHNHPTRKGTLTVPARALQWCLEAAGIEPEDVDAVWAASMRPNPAAGWWLAEEREELAALLPAPLGEHLRLLSHHTAHVLSGYLLSGHEHAAGLVIDAGGSSLGSDFGPGRERITGYDLWPDRIDRLHQGMPAVVPGPVGPRRVHSSLGHFYRNLARRVIPPGDEPEGSMMALAAFGDPQRYGTHVRELVRLGDEGEVRIDHPWGSADSSTPLLLDGRAWTADNAAEQPEHKRADLAAAVQEVFAEAVVHTARHLQQLTRASALVFSGGCALNSHLNGRLAADSGFDTLFVAPAPHDAGTAVGAALYGWRYQLGQERLPVPTDAAWGPDPGALPTTMVAPGYHALPHLGPGLAPAVAALLAEHRIVGWVRGQLEFGPRALGHRSILAHPGHAATRDRLNTIKKRAAYRPFAPAVLAEHATEWFMSAGDPFMNRVATVRRCRADHVAAVTHHDGTARVQSVATDHQGLRVLLEKFRDLTGLPLLLNTSFNRKGTPILRTAEQAVAAAVDLRLDALTVGDTLLIADHVPDPRATSLRTR